MERELWRSRFKPFEASLNSRLYQNSLKEPNIIYTGLVSNVEKYYAALDAILLPSYREGFGNVIIEAAAMGTPAITSDIPGPIDTIQKNITGFVIPKKDVTALSKTMKKIQTVDIEKMGYDSYKFVSTHFDSKILNQKILERKKELLDI